MDNQNPQPAAPIKIPIINQPNTINANQTPPPQSNLTQPMETPWSFWVMALGSMGLPVIAYIIILLNLKKSRSKNVSIFAIFGGVVFLLAAILPILISFMQYGNDITHNRSVTDIYTIALGFLAAFWQHKTSVEPWEQQTGQKAKFGGDIIGWGLLGLFINIIIVIAMVIFSVKFISPVAPIGEAGTSIKTPQQAFANIFQSNPAFSQLKDQPVPAGQVTDQNNDVVSGLVSLKKDFAPQNIINQTTITKERTSISLSGETLPIATLSAQPFDMKIGQTTYFDHKNNTSALDLIANGNLGQLKFDDNTQDAFHLSLTHTDSQNSYLRLDMSDYLLVFIHSLTNGPSKNGVISFNTDSIWPYLGQYLRIPKVVEDKIYNKPVLDNQSLKIQVSLRSQVNNVFSQTLGSPLNYIIITDSKNETISSLPAMTFTANLDSNKFADVIEAYIRGIEKIITVQQPNIASLCRASYSLTADQDKCLKDLAPKTQADIDKVVKTYRSIAQSLKADNIKASINLKDFDVIKFVANISFANTQTNEGWAVALPFKTLTVNIDTENLGTISSLALTVPPNPVDILSKNLVGGNNSFISMGENNSIQNILYEENRQQFLTTAYNTPGTSSQVCSGKINNQYCLTVPDRWSSFDDKGATDQNLNLTRKNDNPNDTKNTSIMISQKQDPGFISGCNFPGNQTTSAPMIFVGSKDIVTQDNFPLRIGNSKPDPMFNFQMDYVCSRSGDHFIMNTPYGEISIEAGSLSFDSLASEVAPILSSLKATGNAAYLNQPQPTLFVTQKPTYTSDPVPQILDNSAGHYVQLYGANLGDDQNCVVDSAYINSTYGLGSNGFAVVADKKSICMTSNSCALCTNGKIGSPSSDLTTCKKQSCNP